MPQGCWTPLVTRETQSKPPPDASAGQADALSRLGKAAAKAQTLALLLSWREAAPRSPSGTGGAVPQKLKIELPHDPAIPLRPQKDWKQDSDIGSGSPSTAGPQQPEAEAPQLATDPSSGERKVCLGDGEHHAVLKRGLAGATPE